MATQQGAFDVLNLILKHPVYQLDPDDSVTIGGIFNLKLDAAWYREKIKQAVSVGIDPYFWIAFSIEEYGGYRVTKHKAEFMDRLGGVDWIPVGRKFVKKNGASGIRILDAMAHSGFFTSDKVQTALKKAGAPNIYGDVHFFSANGSQPQEKVDLQSFIILKQHQDKVLIDQHKQHSWNREKKSFGRVLKRKDPSIMYGLQGIQGYGQLPYLYRGDDFGKGKLKRYENGSLVPSDAFDKSGIWGCEHPLYGFTLAHFIYQLKHNPLVVNLVPSGSQTPITAGVIRDFSAKKGLYGCTNKP